MSTTQRRNRAFCPNCDGMVLVDLMTAGNGVVQTCARCDNAMLFDSREDWKDHERQRVERFKKCASTEKEAVEPGFIGHHYGRLDGRGRSGRCSFCGLLEDMEPEETLPEGVTLDE